MRFFGETKINFLDLRWISAALSAGLILISIASLVVHGGPRLGIDFSGGSQVIVLFAEPPDLTALRAALEAQDIEQPQIQEFITASGRHEALIRTPQQDEGDGAGLVTDINAALDAFDTSHREPGKFDLNTISREELTSRLLDANPLGFDTLVDLEQARAAYVRIADLVLGARDDLGLVASWAELGDLDLDSRVVRSFEDSAYYGGHAVVSQEFVGPQVGRDLQRQTMLAMTWSLVGLLAYITYRFEFRFGVAAVAALVHDVLVALGAFSVTGREFNLPVIAAFLTIVGYSLNDTVVVFDRIRENAQVLRRMPVFDRINVSINQTLSRTILTSGTTLAVVLSLYIYGGQVINDFAFALLVGIIVGTYSSIFVASPIYYELVERRAKRAAK